MSSGDNVKNVGRKEYERGNALLEQGNPRKAKELFQQALRRQKKALGRDHIDTIYSMYMLGRTLHRQDKYSEAERLLRLVVHSLEKKLGPDHEDTLESKAWLGITLFDLKKHTKARELLQQAACGQENQLGENHTDTLLSKYWLGRTVYLLEEYSEAEEPFQQAAQGYEKNYGECYTDTLSSKYWLGLTLYHQDKYSKAEEVLQQAVQGYRENYGEDHAETLACKYWLGCTLYDQRKYGGAEELLQHAAYGYEQSMGREDLDTLYSKYWLGRTLHDQGKYSKAEEVLREAVQGFNKVAKDHEDTHRSKYWLGCTLHKQEKHSEAEGMLLQAAHGQETELGLNHAETITTMRLLHKIRLNSSSPKPTNIPGNITTQALASRLHSFFPEGQNSQILYSDSKVCEISTLLQHSNPRWSKVPRTYIVLRTIGYLNFLDEFIDLGFSDYWFPVTERTLPPSLRPSVRAAFISAQSIILTASMDLEKGEKGQHGYFKQGESPPFETKGILGTGGYSQVDKVLSQISFKEYARKRVLRSHVFTSRRKEHIKQFVAEIEILKRLKHHHIVEFVGSYTDAKYIGLIIAPIADMDLSIYLTRANASNYRELRTFFGCLATALEFLHGQNIRHKDIKPGNILIHRGNVLFADFGLSFDFTDADGSTTISMVNGMTPRYCAPEVALQESRNTMSDIWSLGIVFMEIITVLKGKRVQYMEEFFKQRGSLHGFIRTNLSTLPEFIAELHKIGERSDNRALGWTQQMLLENQQLRPTASSLVALITATSNEGDTTGFCGICCVSSEDDFSDWIDE
jgi:TolA-binding protein